VLTHKSAAVQNFGSSGSGAVVVVQHAAQSLPPLNLTDAADMAMLWTDESVRQALVQLLAENPVLLAKVINDQLLAKVHPTGDSNQHEPKWASTAGDAPVHGDLW
jgi:hypothetical protein